MRRYSEGVTERLRDLFTTYLASGREPRTAASLAAALAAVYPLEAAALLAADSSGATTVDLPEADTPGSVWYGRRWHGRRLWAGSQLPLAARVGDVWLDTCQLTPMLLVPRQKDEEEAEDDQDADSGEAYAWIDMRPVHNWQYATFLGLARFAPREVQIDPPLTLLDGATGRAPRGVETAAAVDLVPDEARLCANWFGKAGCGLFAWQSARAFLSAPTFGALWGEPSREWAGEWDEGAYLAVSPSTIDRDPELEVEREVFPTAAAEERMLFGEWAHSPGTTFRCCVLLQLGLLTEPTGQDGAWYLPWRLVSRAPR